MKPETSQPQHLLDFTRLWTAIRRGRRLWVAFALLGFLGGGVLTVLVPPAPTAVVQILVVHEEDSPADGGSLIRTDVSLLMTSRIAGLAAKRLKIDEQPEDFLKDYEGVAVTNSILQITVKAPSGAEAARRAKGLAEAFIADHVGRVQAGATAEAKAYTDQQAQVQKDLDGVNAQISGAEAAQNNRNNNDDDEDNADAPQPNAANLDTLYARRAELSNQITQLTQQAQQAGLGAPRVAAGTQIVDEPRPVRVSLKTTGATNGGIGLVLGLVVGVAIAAVGGVVRDKPVLRRDIAENLGASVIAELPRRQRRFLPGKKLTQTRKRVAATLVRLAKDGSAPVSVLELGAAPLATALASDIAAELAAEKPVALVADLEITNPPTETAHPVRVIGGDDTSAPQSGEARIGVGSVAPGTAWTDLPHLGSETVLVVKAGYANTAWLHTVGRQLADAGIPIVGVVLADPDRRDKSDGTLWDGLHTALRGRQKHKSANNGHTTNGTNVHDLPTKRFAPVRPAEKKG
ncbi:Wzz/FepE/Etk N-terminal domain-containing protein [Actinophytocola oryzae]|nr:Wzz/FepE/Etk N-terminal domain-containing protein [Actinophytocola oryzae]